MAGVIRAPGQLAPVGVGDQATQGQRGLVEVLVELPTVSRAFDTMIARAGGVLSAFSA